MGFVEEHRARFGVEPICRALQVAPSSMWRELARRRDPQLRPARQKLDGKRPRGFVAQFNRGTFFP